MAEMRPVLSSDEVISEDAPPPSPPVAGKRRQSSASETGSKRRRLSSSRDYDSPQESGEPKLPAESPEPARRSKPVDERKRGRRLFGALLGTLSQTSMTPAQIKRAEIEKRQQAKLKQEAEEDDLRKRRKLEDLMKYRTRQQKMLDKQTMRLSHSNLLATAQFLQTRTEPKLYYKPWELLPEESERITRQVKEAEAIIDRELENFKHKQLRGERGEYTQDEDENRANQPQEPSAAADSEVGYKHHEPSAIRNEGASDTLMHNESKRSPPTSDNRDVRESDREKYNSRDVGDDAGEGELEQGEEDTVLY